jgi:hypothetical protein
MRQNQPREQLSFRLKFFVAALQQELFEFWQSSILIGAECDIDDLQRALVKEYTQAHNVFAASVFKVNLCV